MSDLQKRLRIDRVTPKNAAYPETVPLAKLRHEAADEIDRLQRELAIATLDVKVMTDMVKENENTVLNLSAAYEQIRAELADERLHFSNYIVVTDQKIEKLEAELASARATAQEIIDIYADAEALSVEVFEMLEEIAKPSPGESK